MESFGIKVDVDTKEYFLLFYPNSKIRGINKNEKIKMNQKQSEGILEVFTLPMSQT